MAAPRSSGYVVIQEEECKGCGLCVAICPSGCLELANDYRNRRGYYPARFLGEGCRADSLCYYACPEPGAIMVHRGQPSGGPTEERA